MFIFQFHLDSLTVFYLFVENVLLKIGIDPAHTNALVVEVLFGRVEV